MDSQKKSLITLIEFSQRPNEVSSKQIGYLE